MVPQYPQRIGPRTPWISKSTDDVVQLALRVCGFCIHGCRRLTVFSFLLHIYLEVELQGHMITLCLNVWGTARRFSKLAAPFYIPTSSVWGFQLLHTLPTLVIVYPFDSRVWSGISLWFWFAFPWWLTILSIFHVLESHYYLCILLLSPSRMPAPRQWQRLYLLSPELRTAPGNLWRYLWIISGWTPILKAQRG